MQPEQSQAANVTAALRAAFYQDVRDGARRPWVLAPLGLGAMLLLPVLYLAIPHANRPWLYRARHAVLAVVAALCIESLVVARSSSTSIVAAYLLGCASVWSVIWASVHLVFTRPQSEAERVTRHRRFVERDLHGAQTLVDDLATGAPRQQQGRDLESVRKRRTLGGDGSAGFGSERDYTSLRKGVSGEFEYYWQAFPSDRPFSERLEWAFDLYTSMRGLGWNWCISSAPRFAPPRVPLSAEPVDLGSLKRASPHGFVAYLSPQDFLYRKLFTIAWCYMVLDALSILVQADPYFVQGPSYDRQSLQYRPAQLHPILHLIWRHSLATICAYCLINMNFSLFDVLAYLIGGRAIGWPAWNDVSHTGRYTSVFGSFTAGVLDRGLAGFWGAWWHQTFRFGFSVPPLAMARWGWLPSRRMHPTMFLAASAAITFLLSGAIHAAGSYAALRPGNRWWLPSAFFLSAGVGVVLQQALSRLIRPLFAAAGSKPPAALSHTLRRAGNLVFVFVWLQLTGVLIINDFASSGLFLAEHVPVSLLRGLGLGGRHDGHWWRFDAEMAPHLYIGKHWWDSGLAL